MIPEATIDAINGVREAFLAAIRSLPDIPSFATLCQTSDEFRADFERVAATGERPHVREPATGRITCALIGSSGHGKTTVLDEMFPTLGERGWLETDVTDTTSQALRLVHADGEDPRADEVTVRSWTIEQVKALMGHPDVAEQNARDAIEVAWHERSVVVDGTDASLDPRDMAEWRYPRRVELHPFLTPYQVPDEKRADRRFIRALTVKEQSSVLDPGPVLEHEGRAYSALELRALVESVELRDDFARILGWATGDEEQARKLVFVDTPGLATSSVAKDEVLRHFLGRKSNQLALELLRRDELDVVVHIVLCGQKSQFDVLWNEIERECGRAEMDGLAERLILAINGANIFFTNPDIRSKYTDPETTRREGDHFAATLEDNVLQRMSPRGNVRPARVCFLDSRRIVDGFGDYAEFYARHKPTMASWAEPGGVGFETLRRLGCLEDFKDNIEALADPEDRGQGFLIQQILDLVAEQGERILAQKHLVRTGVVNAIDALHELLERFYDAEGGLNTAAAKEALAQCLGFLDPSDPTSIERFAERQIDPYLDGLVPGETDDPGPDWVPAAFLRLADMVKEAVIESSQSRQIPAAVWTEFGRFFDERVDAWCTRWGYRDTDWPAPPDAAVGTRDLLRHCLRLSAREILFQLSTTEELGAERDASWTQSEDDRRAVAALLRGLETAKTDAERIVTRSGGGFGEVIPAKDRAAAAKTTTLTGASR